KEDDIEGIKVTTVHISKKGAEQVGKKPGYYVTLEAQGIREGDSELQDKAEEVFAKQFASFIESHEIAKDASCLIVGLGNWNVTPDALGPIVAEEILVTKHLFELS